ncbi:hypothetical protein GIB67_007372 [Kingdonia uniflora]|uniref:ZF-HD dimerization-type domain-containing protein n=1 Tax=Kingdonia uniflora TaxID=39325 RepID=A0A7J7NXC6_9MAGN|nr:hypothetical protein GIB67_007372 [Kingdonia uniflora]
MPSPTSLKCFACGCHRNFHRREENSQISNPHCQAPHRENSASPTPISSSSHHPSVPQMLLALSTGVSDKSGARKRYRTKFSKEQKEKMYSFAEKLGWKIPRTGEGTLMMGEYCNDIGVEKGVFKVWMHNHKVTRGKRDYVISGTSTITTSSGNSNLHNRNVEN